MIVASVIIPFLSITLSPEPPDRLDGQFLLNAILLKNIAEPSKGISVPHLAAGINMAKLRKRTAVYDLCCGSHIQEVIQIFGTM